MSVEWTVTATLFVVCCCAVYLIWAMLTHRD
jgi:hypothetical protein